MDDDKLCLWVNQFPAAAVSSETNEMETDELGRRAKRVVSKHSTFAAETLKRTPMRKGLRPQRLSRFSGIF